MTDSFRHSFPLFNVHSMDSGMKTLKDMKTAAPTRTFSPARKKRYCKCFNVREAASTSFNAADNLHVQSMDGKSQTLKNVETAAPAGTHHLNKANRSLPVVDIHAKAFAEMKQESRHAHAF